MKRRAAWLAALFFGLGAVALAMIVVRRTQTAFAASAGLAPAEREAGERLGAEIWAAVTRRSKPETAAESRRFAR